jgi:shikimate dehydrogenase
MKTYGLIGYPLEHSFSQKYFTDKFEKEKLNARYLNFPIASISDFPELFKHHPYLAGLNVTIPYKEQVISFLDELDDTAQEIGAVNVIKISWDGLNYSLKGYNSDIVGFKESLFPLLTIDHKRALVLGTGGASKAVVTALKQLNIEYRYVSRTPENENILSYNDLTPETIKDHKLIINTTPLGMYPQTDKCPSIPYEHLTNEHLLFDLIYNPEETLFLKKGKEKGAKTKNGLEMLYLQAEEAWRIWNEK